MRKRYRWRSAPRGKQWHGHGQIGQGIGNLLRLSKKIIKNLIAKNLGKMALKKLPGVYEKCIKKKKNKNKK